MLRSENIWWKWRSVFWPELEPIFVASTNYLGNPGTKLFNSIVHPAPFTESKVKTNRLVGTLKDLNVESLKQVLILSISKWRYREMLFLLSIHDICCLLLLFCLFICLFFIRWISDSRRNQLLQQRTPSKKKGLVTLPAVTKHRGSFLSIIWINFSDSMKSLFPHHFLNCWSYRLHSVTPCSTGVWIQENFFGRF